MARNKYPARCYRCGNQVEVGQGHYERASYDRRRALNAPPNTPFWIAQHAGCAIKFSGTSHSIWNRSAALTGSAPGE